MRLKDYLSEKTDAILKKWFEAVVRTYPADTSNFLKTQKDPFANPVGHAISDGMGGVLRALIEQDRLDSAGVTRFLDSIIRIRAVQGFAPSEALSFVFSLKDVLREALVEGGYEPPPAEMAALEARIDRLALISFDIYMSCREKLFEVKANEVRDRTFRLLQKANLIHEKEAALNDKKNEQGVDG
jgi:hypothetical protein